MILENLVYEKFIERYENNPVLFAKEIAGITPDKWQENALNYINDGVRRLSIRSCHGPGKTTILAVACLWYLTTRFPVKIVVTAPSKDQIKNAFFPEVLKFLRRLPEEIRVAFDDTKERLELVGAEEESFLSVRTARAENPEAVQGIHAEGGHVLIVVDEASKVDEEIFKSLRGSMSGEGATTVLIGNPTRTTGYFYETFHNLSHLWTNMVVSYKDSSFISPDFVEEIRSSEPNGEDSNEFRIRALGEFPFEEEMTVIPRKAIDDAVSRKVPVNFGIRPVWGVDVATSADRSVLVKRRGNVVYDIQTYKNYSLMQLADALIEQYRDIVRESDLPSEIFIDEIGLGEGVGAILRRAMLPAVGVKVSQSAALNKSYQNLRAELYMKLSKWFREDNPDIPRHQALIEELSNISYSVTATDRIIIDSKETIRKRLNGRSPDHADALMLTMQSREENYQMGFGRDRLSCNRPLLDVA